MPIGIGVIGLSLLLAAPAPAQPSADARQLANYRLTLPVFKRFAHATRLLAASMQSDPRYQTDPLITRDVARDGDAAEMAAALETRLDRDPALAASLFAADISANEYATFALSLFAARLAHGFMGSGALRRVPDGVAADNVAFVEQNLPAIRTALMQLGLE